MLQRLAVSRHGKRKRTSDGCVPGRSARGRTSIHGLLAAERSSCDYHDLLNDTGKEGVMADIKAWIGSHVR